MNVGEVQEEGSGVNCEGSFLCCDYVFLLYEFLIS